MDAYIQDVIRSNTTRETGTLNEKISKPESSLCFKVDFNAIGEPENKKGLGDYLSSDSALQDIFNNIKGYLDGLIKGNGLNPKNELMNGSFGSGQAFNNTGNLPIVSQSQRAHDEETKRALVATLLRLGYSPRQIGLALRNGYIKCGNFNTATRNFVELNDRKQKKIIKNVAEITKPSEIYTYYVYGDQSSQNNDEQQVPEPDQQDQLEPEPERQDQLEPEPEDNQGGDNNGNEKFPWDDYQYENFPWDDYIARPTPRAPRQSNGQRQQSGNAQNTQNAQVENTGNTQLTQTVNDTQNANQGTNRQIQEPIAQTSQMPNLQTGATTNSGLAQKPTSYPESVVNTMQQTAALNPNIASQREQNKALRQIRQNALNKMRSPDYAEGNKALRQNDIDTVKKAYRNARRGNNNPSI